MAAFYITGGEQFQVPADKFAISPSAEGYTPKWSADRGATLNGTTPVWTADGGAVSAYTNKLITNTCPGMWWYLDGNNSKVKIVY